MKTVKINKTELLELMKKNLETHKSDYVESVDGYYEELLKELKAKVKLAKAREEVDLFIHLVKPENHSLEYEKVIRMLEMTSEGNIELTSQEFDKYVMDNWGWSESFKTTNVMYSRGVKG